VIHGIRLTGKEGLAELERDAQAKGLSPEEGRKAFFRFRVFYLAVAEFFGLKNGQECVLVCSVQSARDLTGCIYAYSGGVSATICSKLRTYTERRKT
jgi:hypothetical protein